VLDGVEDYVAEALAVKARGLHAYKVHAAGRVDEDLQVYSAVREAVGDEFKLMCDPVAAYSFDEALRVGRVLEGLGYIWYEEPIFDSDAIGLRRLAEALDIPVVGTEVLAGSPEVIADYLSRGVVDMVRGDVSWKGGITGLLKIAGVAEAFGVQCEVHTAIYHALEAANLHALCAIPNSRYFEVLWPLEDYAFGMRGALDIDDAGIAHPPVGPGLGIELDWDLIDNATVATA
jgi:L-alanine-DL-glutamate epimerase-like enolase superfamily enzyme